MLSIKNGEFGYTSSKPPVISVDQFDVPCNSVVGLLGGNGSGKTTFIKGLSGLLKYSRMESMTLEGKQLTPDNPQFKLSRITVFTEDKSFPNWSFDTYLNFVSSAYKVTPDSTLGDLVAGFNFGQFTNVRMGDLSSGNAKKARLIAALAIKPKLLILDEPVDALDFLGTDFLYTAIRRARENGSAVIMSSHIAESLIDLADTLYVLQRGRITGPCDVPDTREDLVSILKKVHELPDEQ